MQFSEFSVTEHIFVSPRIRKQTISSMPEAPSPVSPSSHFSSCVLLCTGGPTGQPTHCHSHSQHHPMPWPLRPYLAFSLWVSVPLSQSHDVDEEKPKPAPGCDWAVRLPCPRPCALTWTSTHGLCTSPLHPSPSL